ncbi:hypothetical protein [Agromyces rhizosphaerae]|uniref:hypothetical protein n=1 Tax=Agromyces rhizosphaerae TaxID=88374 RepID=UPI002491788F|nr:hypothetical protein [Agromyces rhizosphaerae]
MVVANRVKAVTMVLVWVMFLAISVIAVVNGTRTLDSVAQWGTYVEHRCEPVPKGGCRSIGTWRGDDGTVLGTVLQPVQLFGAVSGEDSSARAAYVPGRWLVFHDGPDVVVQTEAAATRTLVFGWVGVVVLGGGSLAFGVVLLVLLIRRGRAG